MLYEFYMPEILVFSELKKYFRSRDWEDVQITKTMLDNDVSFNIMLKGNGITFMESLSACDLEELLKTISCNQHIFKININELGVSYIAYPNNEEKISR